MFKLKHKPPKPEEGFSILEVLVAAFVITGFLLGSLQAITLATILRVQAQVKSEALNWINSDSEQIKFRASQLDLTGTTYTVDATTCTNSTYGTRFQNNLTSTAPTFPSTPVTLTILNKTYYASRTYAPNSNVLPIRWQVWDEGTTVDTTNNPDENGNPTGGDNDDKSITILSTDVTPSAVLQCP